MGKTSQKEKRLAGQVSLALAAGMFSALPVAYGMPTFDAVNTLNSGAKITFDGSTPGNNTENPVSGTKPTSGVAIDSNQKNTIIDWKDFSVGANEHVKFADNKNFMNIVTGTATSDIEGRISGTGDIYLINPHGVIFGGGAKVDVGNLYVSTKNVSSEMTTAFLKGNTAPAQYSFSSVISAANANTATADVVNLIDSPDGYVRADMVVMEGRNIRFLNSSSVIKKGTGVIDTNGTLRNPTDEEILDGAKNIASNANVDNLVLRTGNFVAADGIGYIHVGDANGNYVYSTNKKIGDNTVVGNTIADKMEKENRGVVNYNLVSTASGLQAINNDDTGNVFAGKGLSGNYMLTQDIGATSMTAPIGSVFMLDDGSPILEFSSSSFKGRFDGMYHTVNNLNSTNMTSLNPELSAAGLFAYTEGATIENVGVNNATLATNYAGGLVGLANNTTLRNVWNTGESGRIGAGSVSLLYVGGIVGVASGNTQLTNAYNAGTVSGAGLIGTLFDTSGIQNAYNIGALSSSTGTSSGEIYGIYNVFSSTGTIENVFTATNYTHSTSVKTELIGQNPANQAGSTGVVIDSASDLSSWISSVGADNISADGGSGKTWRYYANLPTVDSDKSAEQLALKRASLPMLTAFFKGTVSTDYNYTGEQTQGTSGTFNSLDDNPAHKVYDATGVFAYVEATNGAYIIENGKYVLAPSNTAANVKRYNRTTVIKYLGMNVDTPQDANTTPTDITVNDRKNVVGSAEKFALLTSGQHGYDLYGNNFRLDKRNLSLSLTGTALNKVYDGTNTKEVDFSTVQTPTDYISGLIAGDTVGVTGKLTYTYYTNENKSAPDPSSGQPRNCDVGTKYVEITPGTGFGPTEGAGNNYTINLTPPATLPTGKITPLQIKVGLKNYTLPDKVYDTTSDVVEAYAGMANIDLNTIVDVNGNDVKALLSSDGVGVSLNGNVTSNYINDLNQPDGNVAFDETTGAIKAKKVRYTGNFTKSGSATTTTFQLANYTLLTSTDATGKITQREITADDIHYGTATIPVTKEYDGTSALPGTLAEGAVVSVDAPSSATDTGLYAADTSGAKYVRFVSTGTGKYYADAAGTTEAWNATGSELSNRAEYAGYGVRLADGSAPNLAKNYKITLGNTTTTLATDASYNVMVAGIINKRTITAKVANTSVADKTYDGSSSVAATYAGDNKNYAYDGASAGTSATALAHQLVATDVTGGKVKFVTTGTYKATNGEGAADVAYNALGQVIAKNIDFTLALAGANASNYALTVTGETGGKVAGTGKINPKELTVTATQTATAVSKMYDGSNVVESADVQANGTLTVTGWVDSDSQTNKFDVTKVSGTYGTGTTDDNFAAATNPVVKTYDVQYAGLKSALKSKNYTISNTAYGKGMITAKQISIGQLKELVSPKNNLTKTYDGSVNYTADMVAKNKLKSKDYLQVNSTAVNDAVNNHHTFNADVTADLENCINNYMTIAGAVYSGKNAGNYTDVKMSFNVNNGSTAVGNYFDVGNYSFEAGLLQEDASAGRLGTISPKPIKVTLNDPKPTKVYDCDTTVLKANGVVYQPNEIKGFFTLDNSVIVSGDTNKVYLADGITAAYADAKAGTNKKVTYTGVKLNGDAANNYKLVNSQGQAVNDVMQGVGTINKRTVTINDYGYATKTWDGSAAVDAYALKTVQTTNEPSGAVKAKTDWEVLKNDGITDANGVISSGLTATYLNTAGEGATNVRRAANHGAVLSKDVQYTGLATKFGDNYTVRYATGGANNTGTYGSYNAANNGTLVVKDGGRINAKKIDFGTITAKNDWSQEYNGSNVVLNPTSHLNGLEGLPSQAQGVYTVSGVFTGANGKDAGNNKPVQYSITIAPNATGSDNFDIEGLNPGQTSMTINGTGTIAKRLLTPVMDVIKKTYDSNKSVSNTMNITNVTKGTSGINQIGGTLTVSDNTNQGGGNVITGDNVTLVTAGATGTYNSKDVDKATTVTYTGVSLGGTAAGNYKLANWNEDTQKGTATGSGTITKKQIAFNFVDNTSFEKRYNSDAAFTSGDNSNNAALVTAVKAWWESDGIHAGSDSFDSSVDTGKLVGVYGTWDMGNQTFTENSHVKYDGDIVDQNHVAAQDVYYTIALKGDAKNNYEIMNGTKVTVYNEPDKAGNKTKKISDTLYFKDAMQGKGTIRPLAVTMANVSSNSSTIYKVYDGSNSVDGLSYDATTGEVGPKKKFTDYFTLFYDANTDGDYNKADGDVLLGYTAVATFTDGANAGTDKSVGYANFALALDDNTMGDYGLTQESIDAIQNYYNNGTNWTGATPAQVARAGALPTTGSIARRLLVVAADDLKDHSKAYDGTVFAGGNTQQTYEYMVAAQDTQNDNGTGLVGNDVVSVTYTANFVKKNGDVYAVDPNVNRKADGTVNFKDVQYIFTLDDEAAKNYTLDKNARTVDEHGDAVGGTTATGTQTSVSKIKPREVYVDFKKNEAGEYVEGTGLDKIYDGDSSLILLDENGDPILDDNGHGTSLLASGKTVNDILTLVTANNSTGIIAGEENTLALDYNAVRANYVDANGDVSADADKELRNKGQSITTRKVYFQNLNLTGTGNASNYVVMAVKKADDISANDNGTLEGSGSVAQRKVEVGLKETSITKVYDRSADVKDYNGHTYASDNVEILPASGVNEGLVGNDSLGLVVDSAIYFDRTKAGSNTPTNPENYATYNAGEGLGVSYRLKWNNKNYTLEKTQLFSTEGEIKKRTLEYNTGAALSVNKPYDGTDKVKDASAVSNGLFKNVIEEDADTLVKVDSSSHYAHANTGATMGSKDGATQSVTVGFRLNNENYQLSTANTPSSVTAKSPDVNGIYNAGEFKGTGHIDRVQVTLTPTEVSYYDDQLSGATYTGTYSGFVNDEDFPNGYALTFNRDGDKSTKAGSYTLLGYVNGQGASTDENQPLFVTGMENYYFSTTANTALTVLDGLKPTPMPTPTPTPSPTPINPVNPVFPIIPGTGNRTVTQAISETVISDTKFTPDDYSYNRMSKDQDVTRMKRQSSASLQYSDKGVNIDDSSRSGLAALADIQGSGSVVNLEGAFIQTSAPVEQPEKVAETAALPMPEPEENDISSIDLEYADNTDNQQAVLEILTNASSKAENKGTSIVIDTQDEDEEDAEEEKTRRAIIADRSNIGIETLGNAVNLNRMIG